MSAAAYALLGQVTIEADLLLEAPSGGSVRISSEANGVVRIGCDSIATLSEAFQLLSRLGVIDGNYRSIRRLRNPLQQGVEVVVDGSPLLVWRPGKHPRVRSLRKLISFLKHRRN